MFATASDRDVLTRQLSRLVNMGCVPIAFYGAGRVLAMLRHGVERGAASGLAKFDEHVVGVIDDDASRHGTRHAGLTVIRAEEAIRAGAKAIVIVAEGAMQDALWAKRGRFLDAGLRVLCCPERFASQTWDEGLIDQHEWSVGRARGVERAYAREYPDREERLSPAIVDALRARMRSGGSVCEIGSGAGKWTACLIEEAGEYHCVDYSERLLHEVIEPRFAAHRAKLRLHHDEHAKLAGVPDGSIDLVFSIDVFMHFKMDLTHQFLRSIRHVLRPARGGGGVGGGGGVAVLHFATWNEAEIDRWEKHDTAHHNGGTGPIHCTHIDWLRTSARRLGIVCEPIGGEMAWTFLAEFRLA